MLISLTISEVLIKCYSYPISKSILYSYTEHVIIPIVTHTKPRQTGIERQADKNPF